MREEESPFGAYYPDDWEKIERNNDSLINPRGKSSKEKKRPNYPLDQTERAIKILNEKHWFAFKVERYEPVYGGNYVKKDLLGIFDILGIRRWVGETRVIGVQLTTESEINAHIRKMASDKTVRTAGLGEPSYYENSINWLDNGGEILIIGWFKKPGLRNWYHEEVTVTKEMIESFRIRRRK